MSTYVRLKIVVIVVIVAIQVKTMRERKSERQKLPVGSMLDLLLFRSLRLLRRIRSTALVEGPQEARQRWVYIVFGADIHVQAQSYCVQTRPCNKPFSWFSCDFCIWDKLADIFGGFLCFQMLRERWCMMAFESSM